MRKFLPAAFLGAIAIAWPVLSPSFRFQRCFYRMTEERASFVTNALASLNTYSDFVSSRELATCFDACYDEASGRLGPPKTYVGEIASAPVQACVWQYKDHYVL